MMPDMCSMKSTCQCVECVPRSPILVNTRKTEKDIMYEQLADIAALCCIDLNANLNDANKEYMAGDIPHGAFRYVLDRHTQLHLILSALGYTESHKIFGYPVKPEVESKE